jgi:chorismate mutase-like protein
LSWCNDCRLKNWKPSKCLENEATIKCFGYLWRMPALPAEVVASRACIDEIDHAIVELLARRRAVVADLFAKKRSLGLPRFDPARESALIAERRELAQRIGVPARFVEVVFRQILDDSHTLDVDD